jgi:hypothetical membrane protein
MWDLPAALRAVGLTALALALGATIGAALFYARAHQFSFFTTYLSDMGNTPVWPQVLFNSLNLMVIPVRLMFLLLLLALLVQGGAGRGFVAAMLAVAAVMVVTGAAMFAVPFGVDRAVHLGAARIYFFGLVVMQALLAAQEWRQRWPWVLPASSLAVLVLSLVFVTLLSLVGKLEGVTRDTPVIWEWLLYLASMVWLALHAVVLGRRRPWRLYR